MHNLRLLRPVLARPFTRQFTLPRAEFPAWTAKRSPKVPRRNASTIPTPASAPLSRVGNRPLPNPNANRNRILLTAPLFALILFASGAALFNYQKASSSVITSLLYSLRTHPLAREHLGGEIRISGPVPGIPVPWIWGTIDALHGRVDVRFTVSGKRGGGDVEFKAERVGGRSGKFVTEKFVLVREGKVVDLLGGEGLDPMDGGEPVKKSAA